MVRATPQQYAERLIAGVANNAEKIRSGVESVTDSPMEKAAGKKDKWIQGIQDAAANGKWERGLRRVSLNEWKASFINKGIQNMQTGVRNARPKMEAFAEEFFPHLEKIQAKVASMPDVTLEDRLQRMMENARGIAGFKRS